MPKAKPNEEYLGDEVYASYSRGDIVLRLPRDDGDHVICLDPDVFEALLKYEERVAAEPADVKRRRA